MPVPAGFCTRRKSPFSDDNSFVVNLSTGYSFWPACCYLLIQSKYNVQKSAIKLAIKACFFASHDFIRTRFLIKQGISYRPGLHDDIRVRCNVAAKQRSHHYFLAIISKISIHGFIGARCCILWELSNMSDAAISGEALPR